jgi:nucleoside-diphosphate-sugar epimerase
MSKVAITGALSYTGRYLSRRLLDQGAKVVNLSGRTQPIANNILSQEDVSSIETHPLSF